MSLSTLPDTRRTLTVSRHASPVGRWVYATRAPHPALAGTVRSITGYEQVVHGAPAHLGLPSTSLPLVISFGPRSRIGLADGSTEATEVGSFVAGVFDRTVSVRADVHHGVQVDLTPLGAARLLRLPLHEITRQVVPLDALLGPASDRLTDRLAAAPDWAAALDLLEAWLLPRLLEAPPLRTEVEHAWRAIASSGGTVPITQVAHEVGWSRRHLSESFRRTFGVPPKRMARLERFAAAVTYLEAADGVDLAAVAHRAGYADQAHFSREIREFAGHTATELHARRLPSGGGLWDTDPTG